MCHYFSSQIRTEEVRMRGIGGILSSSEKLSIKFMFYICLLTFKLNIHLSKA